MGKKAEDELTIDAKELPGYLSAHHSVYLQVGEHTFYLTDVNENYWRAQNTDELNDKGNFVDCSELVPTVSELLDLKFIEGKSVNDLFDEASFYASEKPIEDWRSLL